MTLLQNASPKGEVDLLTSSLLSDALASGSQGHRVVYDHIRQNILPLIRPDAEYPPQRLIAYAIRNILSPILLHSQITDLLNLVAHMDCIRKKFLLGIETILTWDAYYIKNRNNNPNILVLDASERSLLESFKVEFGERMRRVYREIVNGFSLVDVYETWFSSNSGNVEQKIATYFPSIFDNGVTDTLLFHAGLNVAEREELQDAADRCLDLLERCVRETESRNGIELSPREGRRAYPPLADERHLVNLAIQYVNRLEDAIATTEAILSGSRARR